MDLGKTFAGRGLLLPLRQRIQPVTLLAYIQHEPPQEEAVKWISLLCGLHEGCRLRSVGVTCGESIVLVFNNQCRNGSEMCWDSEDLGLRCVADTGAVFCGAEHVALAPLKMKCAFAVGLFVMDLIPTEEVLLK